MSTVVAWVNGALRPMSDAVHSIFDHVVSYGTGVFEGIRVYNEWDEGDQPTGRRSIWLLREHLARLRRSAELYRMSHDYTDDELARATLDLVARNHGHTYIRPVVFRGHGLGVNPRKVPVQVAIGTVEWGKYLSEFLHNGGASVLITNRIRPPSRMFPVGQAKGGPSYGAWSVPAKEDASDAEASEALLLGEDSSGELFVIDGTGMNLCITERGVVVTPDPDRWNILYGLTLRFLLQGTQGKDRAPWRFGTVGLDRLISADEVFLTGTATEVTPVTLVKFRDRSGQLRTEEIGNGRPGPIALKLQALLKKAAHGQVEQYCQYLVPVPHPSAALVP